jgi:protocatechuate 4,5-dioxygenase beta chain
VGTVDAGEIRPDFDAEFLSDVSKGHGSMLAETMTSERLGAIGNGTHEIRNWLCVMGAVGDVPAEVTSYEAVPAWATGCGAVIWNV